MCEDHPSGLQCRGFRPEELSDDGFLDGRLRLLQPRAGYRAAADPVLLAAAVGAVPGETVLELGCGVGTASLCLGFRIPGLSLAGVEIQPAYADLARINSARNGLLLEVHEADLTRLPVEIRKGFDHVIANPPYFAASNGTLSGDSGRDTALRERTPLGGWLSVAARRLVPGGWLTLIHSADRLDDVMRAIPNTLGSVTVLPVAPRAGKPARRIILRARKGGKSPFVLLGPLVLHAGDTHDRDRDDYTPFARSILRDGGKISAFG